MSLPYPLNLEDLKLIEKDILETWDLSEINAFPNFESFWNEIEIENAYEEDWDKEREYWRPYFYEVFKKLRGGKDET